MLDALVLELEGVVVETRGARFEALTRALADDGVVALPDGAADELLGLPPRQAAAAAVALLGLPRDDTALDLIGLRADRYFTERVSQGVVLREGARVLITIAHARSRLALVTRANRAIADLVLGLSGLHDAFEVIVCADDVVDNKPAPESYARALARLQNRRPLSRDRVLALEDARTGIVAARAAGLRCLAVGEVPAHQAVEADGLVPSLADAGHDVLSELERWAHEAA
ncbi:MAG: HAD-IA family hydrolase [Gemmatimonadota bacterium]|nr:HAD-IA family hydrolase [Gemmatimonadota bacterium]MDE3172894.1 HAD-IA family hydrolase [Gemmatimonadota bacterium]MDE3214796.1 HAD-IA family hydrolase [Gemmatimonadota bacterium]